MFLNALSKNCGKPYVGREHSKIQIMEVYIQLIPANT